MDDVRIEALRIAAGLQVIDQTDRIRPRTLTEVLEAAAKFEEYLRGDAKPEPAEAETPAREPAVPPDQSVFPDYLVCLDDGESMQVLTRHIRKLGYASPADYRTRWGLPSDYPMTAPNYALKRSAIAKQTGLGRR